MYKFCILLLSFFLLVGCKNTEQISENTQQANIKNPIITEIYPIAEIKVENTSEITGIQFIVENTINNKTSTNPSFETLPEIKQANQKNTDFLRSHKDKILTNFPEFKNNPTTERSEKNISITTSAEYHLLNNIYTLHSEEKPNPEKIELTLGIIQNFNNTYTGSLWDLPLASLYCAYCIEAGQIIDDVTIASRFEWMPDNLLAMQKITHWEIGVLSASPVYTIDNTYTQIPDQIIYDLNSLANIFEIFNTKSNPNNSFNIKINLPTTHEISDIIYENWDKKISLKNLISTSDYPRENSNFTQYSIDLVKNEKIIQNSTGKITIFISEK